MFLIYAEITSKVVTSSHREKFELVVAVTAGQRGGISVGKRGVFFDIEEREWDARIVEVVENPISLWEAVKAPFQRNRRTGRAEGGADRRKRGLNRSKKATEAGLEKIDATPAGEEKTFHRVCRRPGSQNVRFVTFCSVAGLVFAAVGSSLAFIVKTLSEVNPLHLGAVVLALGSIVTLSSGLLGFPKTAIARHERPCWKRRVGAVNFRMKLTRRLGRPLHPQAGFAQRRGPRDVRDLIDGFPRRNRRGTVQGGGGFLP